MAFQIISSLQNEKIKDLVKLRQRRMRDRQQLAIMEEPLVIERALAAGIAFETVYFCPELVASDNQHLLTTLLEKEGQHLIELTPQVMTKASYRDKPEGLLVTIVQTHLTLADLQLENNSEPALLIVLEAVEKPGNLGAVLRVADGAGAHGVILCGQGTDLYNPNVLRASRGAFFSVPTIVAQTTEVMEFLATHKIQIATTSPAADCTWAEANLTGPMAIVLGTEHDGLSKDWLNQANTSINIPMLGTGDSLNVSTSAAILLYEARRQRQIES